jgi:ClpP class serine protease
LGSQEEVPEQPRPPPHIMVVIAHEKNEVALQRIAEDIQALIDQSAIAKSYNFLFLYDEEESISENTSSKLYAAASSAFRDRTKPIWLLLHTRGGSPVPAYLISRYLKTSEHGFVAVIPRKAKSAGTLIALGANQIHMGMMSELGPVDPQYSNLPALGLGTALDYIAKVCEKHPGAATMLAEYLEKTLSIRHLGLYERVSESATHYAEKLLKGNGLEEAARKKIAHHLVYDYKDHSFAIDCDEIKDILGDNIVKIETEEYRLSNQIYEYMEQVNMAFYVFHHKYCSFVGLGAEGLSLQDKKD